MQGKIKLNKLKHTVPAEFTSFVWLGLMTTWYILSSVSFTVEMCVIMTVRLVTDDL
jgi:hypothetical protein